jgi:hypothetical protein
MYKTYFVSFTCLNCGVCFESEFEFGNPTPSETQIECKNCGCFTCQKTINLDSINNK